MYSHIDIKTDWMGTGLLQPPAHPPLQQPPLQQPPLQARPSNDLPCPQRLPHQTVSVINFKSFAIALRIIFKSLPLRNEA